MVQQIRKYGRAIKISDDTYKELSELKENIFPFPVSYSKIVALATQELKQSYYNAKKENQKEIK